MSIKFREATGEDFRLVVTSWLDTYRTAHAAGMIHVEDWADVMRPQIGRVLVRPNVKTLVAYHPQAEGNDSDLYGWVCGEATSSPQLVHYLFVKKAYRRMGIASALLKQLGVQSTSPFVFSCKTAVVSRLKSVIPAAKWDPLVVRFPPRSQTPEDSHGRQKRSAQAPPVRSR